MTITYGWRAGFDDATLDALHAAGFGTEPRGTDWSARVRRHSLGWVCGYAGERLVGFVNVPWDGGEHAFLVDTVVAADVRGAGVGTRLVATAAAAARRAGCHWLHVDFLPELSAFYLQACGFRPTAAGLLALEKGSPSCH
ncbi:N-acetyltransferase [Actinoplanes sp. NBRC 14428]|nr:N-acetyltransferase [Actinoplanes sp. NBRC 14428]